METQSLGKKIVPVSEVAEKWKFVGKNLKKKEKQEDAERRVMFGRTPSISL
jgi:hypothetical protein